MKTRSKFFILAIIGILVFFFSNDFGLIDIEKSAIITAVAIDKNEDLTYTVTAQVAVPEATDTNTESKKTEISGSGTTIGGAVKNIGDITGWFPRLSFCNLIILGKNLEDTNVIRVLDYFAKTFRIQDSAVIVMAEDNAKDILKATTPLDSISSFALQKVLLKSDGFNRDTALNNIKSFCTGYYSKSKASYIPIVKILKDKPSSSLNTSIESTEESTSSGGGGSGGSKSNSSNESSEDTSKKVLFDVRTTALFSDGIKKGQLESTETLLLNGINFTLDGSSFEVKDIVNSEGILENYLLTVKNSSKSTSLYFENDTPIYKVDIDLYCKVNDVNSTGSSITFSENAPIPYAVLDKATKNLTNDLYSLVNKEIELDCDFLGLKEKLYRYNFSRYSLYKDTLLKNLKLKLKVNVFGQV